MAGAVDTIRDALATPTGRSQRLRELRAERKTLDHEIDRLELQRLEATAGDGDERHQAAVALIAGADVDLRDLDHRIREAVSRRAVLDDAIRILRERVHADHVAEARATAKEQRPAHRQATLEVARALVALSRALDEEAKVRARIPPLVHAPSSSFPGIGSLRAPDSPISYWFASVVRGGLLDEDEAKKLKQAARA